MIKIDESTDTRIWNQICYIKEGKTSTGLGHKKIVEIIEEKLNNLGAAGWPQKTIWPKMPQISKKIK